MSENNAFSEESLRKIAEQKISYKYSVKIHSAVFILVNILLFTINIIFNLDILANFNLLSLWAFYPLLGWGIGLVMHMVSYSMYAKGVYPLAKRGVIYHFFGFLMVMILLTFVNLSSLPTYLWLLWPGFFWGLGLVAHIVVYIIYFRGKIEKKTGETKSKKERAIEKEMEKMKKKMVK